MGGQREGLRIVAGRDGKTLASGLSRRPSQDAFLRGGKPGREATPRPALNVSRDAGSRGAGSHDLICERDTLIRRIHKTSAS